MTARLPLIVCLLFLLTGSRGPEGFELSEGLEDVTVAPTPEKELNPTVKPAAPKPATTAPKSNPKANDELDLGEALGEDDQTPTEKPQPGGGGGGGGGGSFSDTDLVDHHDHDDNPPKDPSGTDGKQRGRAMQPSSGGEEEDVPAPEKQSVLAGILSAVGVAAVGAISSFIAYQKKKLCFKGQQEDPENVNMDNQKGDQNDPQAQTNLLAK